MALLFKLFFHILASARCNEISAVWPPHYHLLIPTEFFFFKWFVERLSRDGEKHKGNPKSEFLVYWVLTDICCLKNECCATFHLCQGTRLSLKTQYRQMTGIWYVNEGCSLAGFHTKHKNICSVNHQRVLSLYSMDQSLTKPFTVLTPIRKGNVLELLVKLMESEKNIFGDNNCWHRGKSDFFLSCTCPDVT